MPAESVSISYGKTDPTAVRYYRKRVTEFQQELPDHLDLLFPS